MTEVSATGLEDQEAFKCEACLAVREISAGIVLTECHHTLCDLCTTTYFANGVDGVFECPCKDGENICGQIILPGTIKEYFSSEDYLEELTNFSKIDYKLDETEREDKENGIEKECDNGGKEDYSKPGENDTEFKCIVCLAICEITSGIFLTKCHHTFCKPCVTTHLKNGINGVSVCPFNDGENICEQNISPDTIKEYVSSEDYFIELNKSTKLHDELPDDAKSLDEDEKYDKKEDGNKEEEIAKPAENRSDFQCAACLGMNEITSGINLTECHHTSCRSCTTTHFENGEDGVFKYPFKDGQSMTEVSATGLEDQEAFKCEACLAVREISAGIVLTECHHTLCDLCTTTYFANGVDGVFECPCKDGENICGQIILPGTIKEYFSSEDYLEELTNFSKIDYKLDETEREDKENGIEKECDNGGKEDYSKPGENDTEFKCIVCLAICEITSGIFLTKCHHTFCKPCVTTHLKNGINGVSVCPFNDGENICEQNISPDTIKEYVSSEDYFIELNKSTKLHDELPDDAKSVDEDEKYDEKEDGNKEEEIAKPAENRSDFQCAACLGMNEITSGINLTECHHTFCRPCTTTHFENGEDGVFKCPFKDGQNICGQFVLPDTINELFSTDDYFKELNKPSEIEEKSEEDDDNKEKPGENLTEFECIVCLNTCKPKMGFILSACLHKFCKECISSTVKYTNDVQIVCPYNDGVLSCDKTINHPEIRSIVSTDIWDKFQETYINITLIRDREATQCRNEICNQWFYIDDNYYVNNSFVCTACSQVNCILCKCLHNPATLTCEDFLKTQNNPTAHSLEYLLEMLATNKAMRCPVCQEVIMKDLGCDFLTCIKCVTDLCWATQGPRWGPNGPGDTSAGCRCGVNGQKCTPTCQNCH